MVRKRTMEISYTYYEKQSGQKLMKTLNLLHFSGNSQDVLNFTNDKPLKLIYKRSAVKIILTAFIGNLKLLQLVKSILILHDVAKHFK